MSPRYRLSKDTSRGSFASVLASLRPTFRAIAATVVPEAKALDEPAWTTLEAIVVDALAARPPRLQRQLRLLIRLVDWLPVTRYGRRFTGLNAAQRARVLGGLQDAPLLLLRRGCWGLRTLILMGYLGENNAHLLTPAELNQNNQLFVQGGRTAGYRVEQFPVNVKGCKGSSLCNLGCPNQAKQGTNRVQLPAAERGGVEVVTRAEVMRIAPDRTLAVRVRQPSPGEAGAASEWAPGDHRVEARMIVCAAGAVGTPALLLRSGLPLPKTLGRGFTCHPALILVAEHTQPITNDVGHPKSFFVDRAEKEGFVLETCMYFPFTTAKALTGFGAAHSAMMRAFPRQQQILVLAVDHAAPENHIAVDPRGNPVVHYRFSREALDGLVRGNRAAARIFFAAGAVRVHAPFADPPVLGVAEADRLETRIHRRNWKPGKQSISAAHLMGGCAMGRVAGESVTDAWGRVHGVPWLRVADASLFPDALEINPYVTIMALADRVAEGVREDAGPLLG